MIYTDREYLSIITLTEDRDYVTYDELIHVLEERPSDAVYIERDGILCGLIVSGHIARKADAKTHRVPFSKKYTCIYPGEYMRARQIFRDRANFHMLPIVSENGRLLGDYTRKDDFIGTDYADLLCEDPYILQSLKENFDEVVFVKPAVRWGEALSSEIFLWWRQKFESNGIHLRVIQHWEIKEYLNTTKYFLFIDKDEKRGSESLYRYLYHNKAAINGSFFTMIDYLYRMKQLADASFLRELQNQDVFILAFDFKENNDLFLAALSERIEKRYKEYGSLNGRFSDVLKRSFYDELYCEAYKTQKMPLPMSFHTQMGIPYISDAETEFLHVRNGERLTVNQPEKYDRCIYLYGPCIVTGTYVSDQHTISSLLQNEINQAGFSCKVVNRGFPRGPSVSADRLQSASFQRGDIVVLDQVISPVENCPILNLTDAFEEHDAPADWFDGSLRHCNHKALKVYAHAIYEELLPVLKQSPKERTPIELDHDYIDRFYLRHYFFDFDPAGHGTIGSIVMNCNPFTLGHRYLIEEALKTVDFLIIFVVEEDESLFSFQERFAMVCRGTSDLERVMVVPSGPYILSKNTFPEYFEKIDDEDLKKNTEDDITLFAEKIAPRLGITYRFVGEEREDKVTNEYNEAMKRILPRYGIQLVEIPRKANGRSVISASRVRECLSENRMEELDELVPDSTKQILFCGIK